MPLNGINRRVAGLFAIDSVSGGTILLHRGKIGGGQKGVGKKQFLAYIQMVNQGIAPVEIVAVNSSHPTDSNNKVDDVLFIADLESHDAAKQVAKFVMCVANFKEYIKTVVN